MEPLQQPCKVGYFTHNSSVGEGGLRLREHVADLKPLLVSSWMAAARIQRGLTEL